MITTGPPSVTSGAPPEGDPAVSEHRSRRHHAPQDDGGAAAGEIARADPVGDLVCAVALQHGGVASEATVYQDGHCGIP
eukprot:CAMPEP_0197934814 /NCGR_PEP_ID=MMETSP1439-20131203/112425_1 /TAXON_ID=66791 /ORGANISM="Gonyaulax spinifera, Strain CCMP409" /LENGTH=78 /DNA_ID=CAMNT_0043557727 /DNA_START=1 /DNA_END=234 /DNA_ORIENTATION=+